MGHDGTDGPLEFAGEDTLPSRAQWNPEDIKGAWNVLVVDDEPDVHDITRIALEGFSFDGRPVNVLSALSGKEARKIVSSETDIAMILLDVVMEEEDTGLKLVEFIREEMNDHAVRIVMRTGQPGKAPEHRVVSQYDINDYRTKPEFTAQRLFTSVTACLRAYQSLKTIERNRQGLEAIIKSTGLVFKHTSFERFGAEVLTQLDSILNESVPAAYFLGMPTGKVLMVAGKGGLEKQNGSPIESVLPAEIAEQYAEIFSSGGEVFSLKTYLCVFKTKEGATSVLLLKNIHRFTSEERHLLRVYAGNVSIGFDNISLAGEIINTQKEVILILGEVVETRSQETANHVTRVAEDCYLLAKLCGLDDEQAELLRLASPMHDVGKIGVPDSILNKPGRLTADEFNVLKEHAVIGHSILNKSDRPIMKAAAIAALEHHEKWNGFGYPRGLKENQIHIYGRIAAIADVFDALSHKRCYKDVWPPEKIVEWFKRKSGTHFDPELTALFLNHIDAFYDINRRFPD